MKLIHGYFFIMAQPNKYTPTTRFSNSSFSTSRSKIDPLALDTELKNISDSINDIVGNIGKIQRDDGFISDEALGEYKRKIEQEAIAKVNKHLSSVIHGAVKSAVDDYVRTLTFPNAGQLTPAPVGTAEFDLLNILRAANDAKDYAYLEAGTYKITSQIRITPTEYPNIKGIIGKGKGNTIITFDWAQKFDWDSNTNETDGRSECGILIDGVHNKILKDFSIEYKGEFYRKGQSYFGVISCINIANANNCTVDGIEASGANRAGIFVGGVTDAIKKENASVKNGTLNVDDVKNHGVSNIVQNCHAHHNRVAGILIQNQVGTQVLKNLCEYNGHVDNGGTGYGIAAFSGSVNIGIKVIGNTTRKNYRKGIDSHDAYDYEVRDNRSEGDRLFGVAIESRGFPMRNIIIENNTFIQDGAFRLAVDENHAIWSDYKGSDYYRYSAIRVENKSQWSQPWKNQPDRVNISIKNNTISGIEWDGRGIHRCIEIRNNESATHVRLNCEISGNNISGKSVHNVLFAIGDDPAYNGLGNFVMKNNVIDFDDIVDVPFSLQEKNQTGFVGGVLEVSGNTLTTRKNDLAWANVVSFDCANRTLIKFNGNKVNAPSVTNRQIYVSSAKADKLFLEVMNNIFNVENTVEQVKAKFITRNSVPAANINVYNNRLKTSDGELITFDGATSNDTSKTPPENKDAPPAEKAAVWEDNYTLPTSTAAAPNSHIVLNWAMATNDSIPSADGHSIVVQAGNYPPTGWTSVIDTTSTPKYMRSRLKGDLATAGVYPRLKLKDTTPTTSTVVFPMKVVSLGKTSRIKTGLPVIGFGYTEDNVDAAISGGIVAIQGADETKFKFTKMGVYVDGKPYNGADLTIGKTYVFSVNGERGANYINFGSSWNGNGQVSADTFEGVEVHYKSLSPDETVAASLRVMRKVKPELFGADNSGGTDDGSNGGTSGNSGNTKPPAPTTDKNAVFSMASVSIGANTVAADNGVVTLTSVKNVESRADSNDWAGMVVQKVGMKAARSIIPVSTVSAGRYIRVDNLAIGEENSVVIFPFQVESGGVLKSTPIITSISNGAAVYAAGASLSEDGLGFYANPAIGFTVNGVAAKSSNLLEFGKWYIGMMKHTKAIDQIRFGTNHVANVWRNVLIGEYLEIATGLTDEEIQARYEAMKARYSIA